MKKAMISEPSSKAPVDRGGRATRERIIQVAQSVLNDPSATDLTLKHIAARLDMHYTVVYHYFKSRDDLECALIERYSQRRSKNLAIASALPGTAATKVRHFVEREMHEHPTPLILSARTTLSGSFRQRAFQSHRNNRQELQLFINEGISEGCFRRVDTNQASHLINRILDRFANSEYIISQAHLSANELAGELVDFFSYGLSNEKYRHETAVPVIPAEFSGVGESQLDRMLLAATTSFNLKGWKGTSIPVVAASLNMSKTVFYSYASTKEELLFLCANRTLSLSAQVRQKASAVAENPLHALMLEIWYLRELLSQIPGQLLSPFLFRQLSDKRRKVIDEIYQSYRLQLVERLRHCVDKGLTRPLNPLVVQPMITACGYLPINDEFHTDSVNNLMLQGINEHMK